MIPSAYACPYASRYASRSPSPGRLLRAGSVGKFARFLTQLTQLIEQAAGLSVRPGDGDRDAYGDGDRDAAPSQVRTPPSAARRRAMSASPTREATTCSGASDDSRWRT